MYERFCSVTMCKSNNNSSMCRRRASEDVETGRQNSKNCLFGKQFWDFGSLEVEKARCRHSWYDVRIPAVSHRATFHFQTSSKRSFLPV